MKQDKRGWRRWWPIVTVASVLFLVIWWLLPLLLYRHTGAQPDAQLKAITDTRTALLAGLVGVGALLTFWLNSRTHHLTEQGQITDRYSKAVDQLGSKTLDVRLGGIYALERITYDSPRNQDQETIVEVLSAFVRVHSDPVYRLRQHDTEPRPEGWKAWDSSQQEERTFSEEQTLREREKQLADEHVKEYPLPEDVQVAVRVLGRLPRRRGVPQRAKLAKAYLEEVDLTYVRQEKANFRRGRSEKTVAPEAHLQDATLDGADLEGADLYQTILEGAILEGANLEQANLKGANLKGANLKRANLKGAHLDGAELKEADLTEAHLEGAQGLRSVKDLTSRQLATAHL